MVSKNTLNEKKRTNAEGKRFNFLYVKKNKQTKKWKKKEKKKNVKENWLRRFISTWTIKFDHANVNNCVISTKT